MRAALTSRRRAEGRRLLDLRWQVPDESEVRNVAREFSRSSGLTLEGAATVLLTRAATRQHRAPHRHSMTFETRWVTTPSTYLAGETRATSTPEQICEDAASHDPAVSSFGVKASPVRAVEGRVEYE